MLLQGYRANQIAEMNSNGVILREGESMAEVMNRTRSPGLGTERRITLIMLKHVYV